MLLTDFNKQVNDKFLDFLWDQWTRLGVLGRPSPDSDDRVIDPEALILFSLTQARYDARLFDEMFDWILVNERKISLQRLKALAGRFSGDETGRVLKAVAGSVYSRQGNARWKAIAGHSTPEETSDQLFFLKSDDTPVPVFGKTDSAFKSAGWLRSELVPRGTSVSVPLDDPGNIIFLLRSLFGLTPRAEIVAYIFAVKESYVSDLVRTTGYSKPAVYDALNELVQGGFVLQRAGGAGSVFYLPDGMWEGLLRIGRDEVRWVDWPRVLSAFGKFRADLGVLVGTEVPDYLLRSRLLTMAGNLNRGLAGSGLANPFAFKFTLGNVLEELPGRFVGLRL